MSRKNDFQKIFGRKTITFSHRNSGIVVRFSLRVREVPGSIPGCHHNKISHLKNSTLSYHRRNLIRLIKRSYQMLEANFLTIAHIDQKGIPKIKKKITSITLLVD